jgi:hypothetical protein
MKKQMKKQMKKIGITNHPDFPIDEWSKTKFTLDELFDTPIDLNSEEIEFANDFMESVQLDTDDDEGLIELIMKRSSLKSFLVHMKRLINQHQNKNGLNEI